MSKSKNVAKVIVINDAGKHTLRFLTTEAAKAAAKMLAKVPGTVSVEVVAKTMEVTNLMSGKAVKIADDTPLCCNPSSETYWSM